jgi:hypothetical protein
VLLRHGQRSRGPMRCCLAPSTARGTAMWRWCAGSCACRSSGSWKRRRSPHRHGYSPGLRRASCRTRTRARFSPRCGFRKALRSPRRGSCQAGRGYRAPNPGRQGVLSVVGLNFIDYVASSNQAFLVIRLKPYEERTDPAQSAGAIIARLRPQMGAIQGAVAFPFNLPPILGLGNTGGFKRPRGAAGSVAIRHRGWRCAAWWWRRTASLSLPSTAPMPPRRADLPRHRP